MLRLFTHPHHLLPPPSLDVRIVFVCQVPTKTPLPPCSLPSGPREKALKAQGDAASSQSHALDAGARRKAPCPVLAVPGHSQAPRGGNPFSCIASLYPTSARTPSGTMQTPEGFRPAHLLVLASSGQPKIQRHCEPGAGQVDIWREPPGLWLSDLIGSRKNHPR